MTKNRKPYAWATAQVALSTLLLPPGPVRHRYRTELTAELWGMTGPQQLAHAVSTLLAAPRLHRTLVETGALVLPHSPLWCRLHLHHRWATERNPDGRAYRRCRACGLDDDGLGPQLDSGTAIYTQHFGRGMQ